MEEVIATTFSRQHFSALLLAAFSCASLLLVGVAAGITGALLLAGLIRTLLFGVGLHDPVTLALAPVTLALVALLAAWIPSRRAAALDPACALRAG